MYFQGLGRLRDGPELGLFMSGLAKPTPGDASIYLLCVVCRNDQAGVFHGASFVVYERILDPEVLKCMLAKKL